VKSTEIENKFVDTMKKYENSNTIYSTARYSSATSGSGTNFVQNKGICKLIPNPLTSCKSEPQSSSLRRKLFLFIGKIKTVIINRNNRGCCVIKKYSSFLKSGGRYYIFDAYVWKNTFYTESQLFSSAQIIRYKSLYRPMEKKK